MYECWATLNEKQWSHKESAHDLSLSPPVKYLNSLLSKTQPPTKSECNIQKCQCSVSTWCLSETVLIVLWTCPFISSPRWQGDFLLLSFGIIGYWPVKKHLVYAWKCCWKETDIRLDSVLLHSSGFICRYGPWIKWSWFCGGILNMVFSSHL